VIPSIKCTVCNKEVATKKENVDYVEVSRYFSGEGGWVMRAVEELRCHTDCWLEIAGKVYTPDLVKFMEKS